MDIDEGDPELRTALELSLYAQENDSDLDQNMDIDEDTELRTVLELSLSIAEREEQSRVNLMLTRDESAEYLDALELSAAEELQSRLYPTLLENESAEYLNALELSAAEELQSRRDAALLENESSEYLNAFELSAVTSAQESDHPSLDPSITEEVSNNLRLFVGKIEMTEVAGLVIGTGGSVLKWLNKTHGVVGKTESIKNKDGELETFFIVRHPDIDVVTIFLGKIKSIKKDPEGFNNELKKLKEAKNIHLYIDISNVSISAQVDPITGIRDPYVRLHASKLIGLVKGLGQVKQKLMAGSGPPRSHSAWTHWEKAGFDVKEIRILTKKDCNEEAVDDVLHSCMQRDILKDFSNTRTMILMTGVNNLF